MPLPPDRGHIDTEQRHEASDAMDQLETTAAVDLMIGDLSDVQRSLMTARSEISGFIDALVPRVGAGGRLVYIGAGTSGRLGVLDASECPPTFNAPADQVIGLIAGGDSALRRSSESKEDDPAGTAPELAALGIQGRDTVLGIAAGGTTPYVLGALRLAASRGAMTGLLTCAASLPPPPSCDHLIRLPTGAELITGSTRLKAGTATKVALNIISTVLFVRLGKVYGNLMVDLRATNDKLMDRAIRIFQTVCHGLSRHEAALALHQADGCLKTAIVMQGVSVTREEAQRLLEGSDGNLRGALEG